MTVASLELCKELYELSDWDDNEQKYLMHVPTGTGEIWDGSSYYPKNVELVPAYSLGYLLRKLPQSQPRRTGKQYRNESLRLWKSSEQYVIGYQGIRYFSATTPEDAACKLAIELFKQGVLKHA